eukprot:snap_masked-scaffold_1-processed-gene-0.21-mRNA-1 protein AED:1.00 eAED:1.00 QI:0/-1/0/0/-1/1/1/0/73
MVEGFELRISRSVEYCSGKIVRNISTGELPAIGTVYLDSKYFHTDQLVENQITEIKDVCIDSNIANLLKSNVG